MPVDYPDDFVLFEGVWVRAATGKAVLCCIQDDTHWIPKSEIHPLSEVRDDTDEGRGPGILIIPEWLAAKKRLVWICSTRRRTRIKATSAR